MLARPTALAIILLACGGARPPQKNRCAGANCAGELQTTNFCATDDDCPLEEFCDGGQCSSRNSTRPDDACTIDDHCPVGQMCNSVTGYCVDCLNDSHCYDPGESCQADGTCGTNSGCSSNFDCSGLVCDSSSRQCVQCLSSADCPVGQTCRDSQCFTTDGGDPQCSMQSDCDAYGRICELSTGRCVPCTTDVECGFGRICSAGTCTTDPGTGGGGGGGGDGSCSTRDECAGQACFLGSCMPCFSDFMCSDLTDLLTGTTKICDSLSGNCVDPECNTADQCAPGEGCYTGHCGACLYDDECRAGETCDPNTGVCGTGGSGGGGCTSNAQCGAGQVCVSGSCGACTSSTQCDAGLICDSTGSCVNGGTGGCTSNSQCGGGQVCLSGACSDCSSSTQCDVGGVCSGGRCTTGSTGSGGLGNACTTNSECGAGFVCLGDGTSGICSRPCIGSGKGGDADCPTGYGCINYETGSLDGLSLCNGAAQLDATYPGQPFDMAPGSSCAAGNGCQTSVCYSTTQECARACIAGRDCASGEVCWAVTNSLGDMLGYHLCTSSDTTTYTVSGGACNDNFECDSGLCVGTCDDGAPCNATANCSSGVCNGTCRDHCRSNADCSITQSCNPWPTVTGFTFSGWVPTCLPKFYAGTQNDGSSCAQDADCASDWCIGSICTTPCAITADCTGGLSGTMCTPMSFVDSAGTPVYSMAFCQ